MRNTSKWLINSLQIIMLIGAFRNSIGFRIGLRTSSHAPLSSLSMAAATETKTKRSVGDQVQAASVASAATVAFAAVNAAVSMKPLSAPDGAKTFVYKDGASLDRIGKVDEVGLPLVYDKELIQAYWTKQGSALSRRWTEFLGYSVPYLTKVITILVAGGSEELKNNGAELGKDAREIFEKLGPTYIKMGQMMSVRPDVLPPAALNELKVLQDSVKPFDSQTAINQIEKELGGPLGQFFSEISEQPVAAASLAQVYKAKLSSTGEYVAAKIQRPGVLEIVSKDLYVLRRAAEVYQGLIDRFAPQQKTNYVALLNEWAVGFYTELDFLNEAANQQRLASLLTQENVTTMYIPKVYQELCTRRILVSEWIDGCKLSNVDPDTLKQLIPAAQETFLTQLLQIGFFHADPHPGNIIYMKEPHAITGARMALIDFGLVASIRQVDMDTMVSALIHLANRDYTNLVDDFISLGILPGDVNRGKVIPLMDKALTPYVKGGGAKTYEEELRKIYGMDGTMRGTTGGFQAMTQDALTVLNDIPFSIPPYFALLGRAIVTLEGVALSGDPSYGIIMESYPFVARKLLKEDRPEIQKALQQVLYSNGGSGADGMQANRLSVLLNSALGIVAKQDGSAFVDFDSIPEDGVTLQQAIKFLLSPSASSLRKLLLEEAVSASDILSRQVARKAYKSIIGNLPRPPSFLQSFLPKVESVNFPFFIPKTTSLAASIAANRADTEADTSSGKAALSSTSAAVSLATSNSNDILAELRSAQYIPMLLTSQEMLDTVLPALTREEEIYAISLTDLSSQTLGTEMTSLINGNAFSNPRASQAALVKVAALLRDPLLQTVSQQPAVKRLLEGMLAPVSRLIGGSGSGGSVGNGRRFAAAAASSSDEVEGMDQLVAAMQSLTPEEQLILQETVQELSLNLLKKMVNRARTLLK